MRVRTLPTIKNKESALRMEVKKSKDEAKDLEIKLEQEIAAYDKMMALWSEFDPTLIKVKDVELNVRKIAGVRVPVLSNIEFDIPPFSLFSAPSWYVDGLTILIRMSRTAIERDFTDMKLSLLVSLRKTR